MIARGSVCIYALFILRDRCAFASKCLLYVCFADREKHAEVSDRVDKLLGSINDTMAATEVADAAKAAAAAEAEVVAAEATNAETGTAASTE